MITQNLQKQIAEAMKARDEVRLSTLRMLSSALNYEKIEKRKDLTDEEELVVIRKEAKQRKDSIESYNKAGESERANREQEELKILQEFLPPEMDVAELETIIAEQISEVGASGMADMGRVMAAVKAKAPGADGAKIAEIVKSKLS